MTECFNLHPFCILADSCSEWLWILLLLIITKISNYIYISICFVIIRIGLLVLHISSGPQNMRPTYIFHKLFDLHPPHDRSNGSGFFTFIPITKSIFKKTLYFEFWKTLYLKFWSSLLQKQNFKSNFKKFIIYIMVLIFMILNLNS